MPPDGQTRTSRVFDAVTSQRMQRVAWPMAIVLGIGGLLPSIDDPVMLVASGVMALGATAIIGCATDGRRGMIAGMIIGVIFTVSAELRSPDVASGFLGVLTVAVLAGVGGLAGIAVNALRSAQESQDALGVQLREAERRREIDRALAECAQAIAFADRLTGSAYSAFRRLLIALDLDVLIVRRNVDDGTASEVALWVTRGDSSDEPEHTRTRMEWDRLPEMRRRLQSNESYAFSSLEELPAAEAAFLSTCPAKLESAMNLPIWVGRRWLGHVAFGQLAAGRHWSPKEMASLRVISDMLGTMWVRDLHTTELQSSITEQRRALNAQRALADGTRILLSPESDRPLEDTLRLVMEAVSADVAYIEEVQTDPELGIIAKPIHQLYRDPTRQADDWAWPFSSEPAGAAKLQRGEIFRFGSQAELNADDPDRSEYLDNPLTSELNVPVMPDTELTHIVGVGDFVDRDWTDIDEDVLTGFARMLAAYFQREKTTKKLEDLVSAKDRFIASVSHELRTPLSVVVGLAAELDRDADLFSERERKEFMAMIRRQSREVSDIIDDLLVSTRINETSLTIFPEQFELDRMVRQVIDDLPAEITQSVDVQIDGRITVTADPVRTRQIVRNLLTNAHRYGGEHVTVHIGSDDGVGVLDVTDDGDGVPPDRRESIFDAYQTSGEERIVTAAIGLGLTVSRQLARLMGGDVSYHHDELPTFRLSLPASRQPAPQLSDVPRAQAI